MGVASLAAGLHLMKSEIRKCGFKSLEPRKLLKTGKYFASGLVSHGLTWFFMKRYNFQTLNECVVGALSRIYDMIH